MHLRTKSADDTRALAGEVAALSRPGDIVVLAGDLGAGKTTFAQGLGRAIGVLEPITSPTFTLVRTYDTPMMVFTHIDVYRLDHMQELVDLGLSELLDESGVTLIEWGDVIAAWLPADFLEVRLEMGDDDDERAVTVRAVGRRWSDRLSTLARAAERWQC